VSLGTALNVPDAVRRKTTMSFDKNDVKHGIDNVAAHLKDAVDAFTEKTSESREKVSEKVKEMARKTGDELIEQGQKLKHAASVHSSDAASDHNKPVDAEEPQS
jgi:hypothetical protein